MALHQVRDDLEGLGHGQWDFDDGNPALRDCLGAKKGVLLRGHANRGNDPGFLDPAPHLVFLHLVASIGAGLMPISAKLSFAIQRSWKPTAQKKAGFCLYLSAYGSYARPQSVLREKKLTVIRTVAVASPPGPVAVIV